MPKCLNVGKRLDSDLRGWPLTARDSLSWPTHKAAACTARLRGSQTTGLEIGAVAALSQALGDYESE